MKIKTEFRVYENVYLKIGKYMADNSIAIEAWNRTEGSIARITVCLTDPFLRENESYVDTNNCPWALDFIREYELGKESGYMKRSGYCNYPAVSFDMEQIKKYIREGE